MSAKQPNEREAGFWKKLKASTELFAELQRRRISEIAEFQSRDKLSLTIAGLTFFLIAMYLIIIGWQREHTGAYLMTKKTIVSFPPETRTWHISHMPRSGCASPENCYQILRSKNLVQESFENLSEKGKSIDKIYGEPSISLIRTVIGSSERNKIKSDYLGIGMPSAYYDKAYSFVNGQPSDVSLLDARIGLHVYSPRPAQGDLVIDVLYESDGSGMPLFIPGDEEPLLITTTAEYRSWVRMLTMQSARQGGWLTDMSFIVMAALFLMIFLFVDSSPEVLGLGLFMGFEALSRSLQYGWIPMNRVYALDVFLSGASYAMRLYYVLQLCRIGLPRPRAWILGALGLGLLISAGSWLREFGIEFTPDYSEIVAASVDVIFSMVGVGILGLTLYFLRGKRLAWRKWALFSALVACFLQAYGSLDVLFPELTSDTFYFRLRSVILPLSTYLLAASAFINISSLENRVKTLSRVQAKNEEIEKELELGRIVQGAFLRVPELPRQIDFAYYYEAAFFVSGDAYFIESDRDRGRLVVILGDMTGHGVQAALKSTTMQTVARSFFRSKRRSDAKVGARFEGYHETLAQLFHEAWGPNELPTFIAGELDTSSGEISMFRSNFPFALLIQRTGDKQWTANVMPGRTAFAGKLSEGELVVFASDGIIDSSRRVVAIKREVEAALAGVTNPSAELVKNLILGVASRRKIAEKDDMSMIVFGVKEFTSNKNRKDIVA